MATPKELVESYGDAFAKKDFDRVRSYLHKASLSFRGPIEAFDKTDDLVAVMRRLGPIIQGMEKKKVFVDGNDVCVIYDFVTNLPDIGTSRMAEGFHGRVARSRQSTCTLTRGLTSPCSSRL